MRCIALACYVVLGNAYAEFIAEYRRTTVAAICVKARCDSRPTDSLKRRNRSALGLKIRALIQFVFDSMAIKARMAARSAIACKEETSTYTDKKNIGKNMKTILKSCIAVAATIMLAACVSTPVNPFVGMWDLSINTPVGAMGATLDVSADMMGSMSSPELGATQMQGITVTENAVSFNVLVDAQGQTLALSFAGTIDGDALSGNFDSDFGAIPVTGTRQ